MKRSLLIGLLIGFCWLLIGTTSRATQQVDFERDIRPLLHARCVSCHGPSKQQSGLRLDIKAPALKGGISGAAIVPGRSNDSLLMRRVTTQDKAEMMPPTGERLSAREIALLKAWIDAGADWPETAAPVAASGFSVEQRRKEHWCWQPVRTVPLPAGTAKNPIDRFLHNAKEPADRLTLLRRVTFDLTGLPPTSDEISAFEKDGHYERVVDALLASPRFGERMARRWMDVIRFAESHGSEGDPAIPLAWRYRDYLIRAFNSDVPYDQLIKEHLAGDLLTTPRINQAEQINESLLATAHFRMVEHGFQPVEPWEDRVKWTDNQVDVVAKAFQGVTVSCARCHDHKFDAISQKDYYALFGIFAGARPTQVAIDAPAVLTKNREQLAALKPRIKAALAKQWQAAAEQAVATQPADIAKDKTSPLFPLVVSEDEARAWFAEEQKELAARAEANRSFTRRWDVTQAFAEWPRHGTGIPAATSPPGEFAIEPAGERAINGIYPAGVYSGLLSRKHNAVLTSPRFRIDTDSVSFQMLGGNFGTAQLIIENYAVPRGGTVYTQRYTAKADQMGWVRWDTTFWKGFTAYFEFATKDEVTLFELDSADNARKPKPTPNKDGRSWFGARGIAFHNGKDKPKEELTPARLLLENAPATFARDAVKQQLQKLLQAAIRAWERNQLTDEQAVFLDYFVRQGLLPNAAATIPLIAEYRQLESEIAVPRRAPGVLEEAGPDHPLLVRGDHKRLGAPVPRGHLTALGGARYSDPKTTRLRLAEEIASANNPLTARVMVNRLWQYTMRNGLVGTPDNFGLLGDKPSHPELLDWLAHRFVTDGWSIKKMLRLLVMSEAYQSRALPLRRLEAEEIRDAILAVSGQLDLTMYGESIPVYYAHDTGATKGDRPKGPLDGARRRSVYLQILRNATNPFLEAFDVYKPTSTRGKRDVTNVPAQSLTLLNSPFVVEQAGKWAAAKPAINDLYLRALGRPPTATEHERAQQYLTELRATADDQQAIANLAQALFNLKEFVYVR